jgi:hypothetical protein
MSSQAKPKVLKVEYNASATGIRFHNSNAFVRCIMGPVGSGKSVACAFELFRLGCGQRPNSQGIRQSRAVIVRNTLPELKSTTMKTWFSWFPEGDPKKDKSKFGVMSRQPPYTHFVQYGLADGTQVEMEVIFLALDQADDAKKLLSLECSFIWYNEAREILKEIIDAGTGRVGRYPSVKDGGCTRKAIIMDTNPPDDAHWWHEFSEVDTPEGWAFFRQPSGLAPDAENLENLEQPENWPDLTLPERRKAGRRYYESISAGKDPEWIEVYVHGNYGTISKGVPVYASCWSREIHVARQPLIIIPKALMTVGIDCSGRHPALVYLQHAGRSRVEVVRELCIMDDKGMGAERFARYFVEDIEKHFPGAVIDEIWGDPAGDSPSQNDDRTYFEILNQELRQYRLKAKPSPGLRFPERYEAVEYFLSNLVEGLPMLQVSPSCKVLVQGFNGKYMFKQINTAGGGTRVDDRPVKNRYSNPHDALQYALCGLRLRGEGFKRARSAKKVLVVPAKGSIF